MKKEIGIYHALSADATYIARNLRRGIAVKEIDIEGGESPEAPFIFINGDGYLHHYTRILTQKLKQFRTHSNLGPFSYIHIDGHDDMAPMYDGDNNSFKSFVVGIAETNEVYLLEEGLTGHRDNKPRYYKPLISKKSINWSEPTMDILHPDVYLSIDLDVLDAGVKHLFPQVSVGFTIDRLLWTIEKIQQNNRIISADIVGFSLQGASELEIEESLTNIGILVNALTQALE